MTDRELLELAAKAAGRNEMSPLFKVGDLVVRNPEARGEAGWPYDDAVCRVVDDYPDRGTVIEVVPVNSPPNKRYQGTGWLADRFTPAARAAV